jgi:hypothetical protein
MEVNGDKKRVRIRLDISPLLFCTVPKLVQTDVVKYDEIFQALAIGDVLLRKPFLDLGFDGVVRWKSLASKVF